MNIIVSLDEFQTVLSYIGSVGYFINRSGLEDMMGMLYGNNMVENVLDGKDYECAVRHHFLVHCALEKVLFEIVFGMLCNNLLQRVCFHYPDCPMNYRQVGSSGLRFRCLIYVATYGYLFSCSFILFYIYFASWVPVMHIWVKQITIICL